MKIEKYVRNVAIDEDDLWILDKEAINFFITQTEILFDVREKVREILNGAKSGVYKQ